MPEWHWLFKEKLNLTLNNTFLNTLYMSICQYYFTILLSCLNKELSWYWRASVSSSLVAFLSATILGPSVMNSLCKNSDNKYAKQQSKMFGLVVALRSVLEFESFGLSAHSSAFRSFLQFILNYTICENIASSYRHWEFINISE